jgi:hypothetical protein
MNVVFLMNRTGYAELVHVGLIPPGANDAGRDTYVRVAANH